MPPISYFGKLSSGAVDPSKNTPPCRNAAGTLMNLRVHNTRLLSYACWHGVFASAAEARRAWGLGYGTSSRSGGSFRENTSSDIELVTLRTSAAASVPSRVRALPTRESSVGEKHPVTLSRADHLIVTADEAVRPGRLADEVQDRAIDDPPSRQPARRMGADRLPGSKDRTTTHRGRIQLGSQRNPTHAAQSSQSQCIHRTF